MVNVIHIEFTSIKFCILSKINITQTIPWYFFCFFPASGLVCYECEGTGKEPTCNANETCSTGYTQCISSVEKDDGKTTYKKGCALPAACTGKKTFCAAQKLVKSIEDCAYKCCDEDKCNKDFPSLSSGVQVTSGLVAIGATLVFSFFVMWTIC